MGRPKKLHYSINQPVVFNWSRVKKYGTIFSRTLRGKKMYYDVLGDDGKVYEDLYTDDSEIACILSKETAILTKALEQKKAKESGKPTSSPAVIAVESDTTNATFDDDEPF